MVTDPRSPKPGSSEPDDALDLLRALAHSHESDSAPPEDGQGVPAPQGEKFDALRELATKLDRQLKSPDADPAPTPGAFRRFVGQGRQRTIGLAAVGLLALLALAALGFWFGRLMSPEVASVRAPATDQTATPPAQSVPPAAAAPADIPAITKAMSDCDAAAASDPDSLYFLVLPLRPANLDDQSWNALALQTVGSSYLLLSTKDALDGLRNNSLTLRPDRYTFSALDAESGQTYSWTSATGMSRLARRDSGAVKTLKLGLDFSEAQAGAQWSAAFKREPGICYWVSALTRE
jgi:hypothetical protein